MFPDSHRAIQSLRKKIDMKNEKSTEICQLFPEIDRESGGVYKPFPSLNPTPSGVVRQILRNGTTFINIFLLLLARRGSAPTDRQNRSRTDRKSRASKRQGPPTCNA